MPEDRLFRLAIDASVLKRDSELSAQMRELNRAKMDIIETSLADVHRKLDRMLGEMNRHENRLQQAEAGVDDWRWA